MSPRIDAHVHLWNRSTDPQPWIDPASMAAIDRDFTADDLDAVLSATDMQSAIVVQSSNSAAETLRLLDGATERVAGVVGWLDVTRDVAAQIETLSPEHCHRLVGVRHLVHIDPDPEWLARPDVERGIAALAPAGLAFDLVVRWWQLPLARALARNLTEVSFVLDHLGGPPIGTVDLDTWARSLRDLGGCPNVSVKLSGVADPVDRGRSLGEVYRPVFEIALDAVGARRVMYGSDWPLVELAGGAPRWRDAVEGLIGELSTDERAGVLGDNASGTYRLDRR